MVGQHMRPGRELVLASTEAEVTPPLTTFYGDPTPGPAFAKAGPPNPYNATMLKHMLQISMSNASMYDCSP